MSRPSGHQQKARRAGAGSAPRTCAAPIATVRGDIADPDGRFVLRPPAASDREVQFWMTARLAYEKKPDWQQCLMRELRAALASVEWAADKTLSGAFATPDQQRCDAENLLFYNPGAAVFSALPRRLMFERAYEVPEPPPELSASADGAYFHAYYSRPLDSEFRFWEQVGTPLASFAPVSVGSLTGDQAGRLVWWWLRQSEHATRVDDSAYPHEDRFGVRLTLAVPVGRGVKLAGIVKPVFDGVIGSFHQGMTNAEVHRGAALLWPKIASAVPDKEALVDALLSDATRVLPGPAYKVHRTSVQLHPADHQCVAGCLQLRESRTTRSRTLTGELFRVTPRHP